MFYITFFLKLDIIVYMMGKTKHPSMESPVDCLDIVKSY